MYKSKILELPSKQEVRVSLPPVSVTTLIFFKILSLFLLCLQARKGNFPNGNRQQRIN